MSDIHPAATFPLEGSPDRMAFADGAVWVTSARRNDVVRLDAATNLPTSVVSVNKPGSGLAAGFRSIWIASCEDRSLVRVDERNAKIAVPIGVPPSDSKGGIATGAGSPDNDGSQRNAVLHRSKHERHCGVEFHRVGPADSPRSLSVASRGEGSAYRLTKSRLPSSTSLYPKKRRRLMTPAISGGTISSHEVSRDLIRFRTSREKI